MQRQTCSLPVSSELELVKIPQLQHKLKLSVADRLQLSSNLQSAFSGGVLSLRSSTTDCSEAMSVTEVSPCSAALGFLISKSKAFLESFHFLKTSFVIILLPLYPIIYQIGHLYLMPVLSFAQVVRPKTFSASCTMKWIQKKNRQTLS